ncbi:hypothetical protein [Nocardiopsis metallicus]|uniref:Uncharacterized protein n=1 Tax=Nocardiopsis metallicus TaxID=179819 RepID=A0A840W3C1_9ACTN|nr:hypothetical protein [Nocardiopsis metallicus]MBB5489803.1 hypothetical protein [Nocardiopsis metallicus]
MLSHEPTTRDRRLTRLGTSWPLLRRVLLRGEAGWRAATDNHGDGARSQYAYRERLAALREEQKLHHGWDRARVLKIELTVDPERTIAFQTLIGDRHTGMVTPERPPRNLHPRGPNGQRLLGGDGGTEQLTLFPDHVLPLPPREEIELTEYENLQVWVFLVHREHEPDTGRVRWHSELSRPHPPDEAGYLTRWQERVPLPVLEIGAVTHPVDEGQHELDIQIGPR